MPSALSPLSRLLVAALLTACGTDPADKAPGSEVDSAAPPPAPWSPVTATATCSPGAADTCGLPAVDGLWTAYRKDAYFPDEVYDEYTDSPVDGGRVHVLATATATGSVTQVTVDGLDIRSIEAPEPASPPPLDWAHVWPTELVEGQPVWVSFHSREPHWDTDGSARLRIETDGGTAVDTDFSVAVSPLQLTAVTTADRGATRVLFVRNGSSGDVTLDRVLLDGVDATDAACIATPTLAPGEVARITVPLCTPAEPGQLWSAVVTTASGLQAAAGGRVVPERFVTEAWKGAAGWSGADCTEARLE